MFGFVLGIIIGALFYFKILRPMYFWKNKEVKHEPSWPLIGNLGSIIMKRKHMVHITDEIYKKYPQDRYVGYIQFTRPVLMIRDLELIKQMGVKQFDHFHDHVSSVIMKHELLSKSLIRMSGEEWRKMRATLSPAFTSSKMRNMYHLIGECAENFVNHFKGKEQVAVEMKDVFSRFTNDVIASTAFGITVNSLEEPNHEFFEMGKKLTSFNVWKMLKVILASISPYLAQKLKINFLPEEVVSFFRSLVKNNINKRESEGIVRPDLIHLLMEARKGKLKHDKEESDKSFASVKESNIGQSSHQMELTDDHIVAQALLFFFAGFETASTASSFMAHELAINPDIQKKLQEEIDSVSKNHEGNISYDTLQSMKYLDQVISETLRKWPPGFQTDRVCTRDYVIQPKKHHEKAVVIEKGVDIVIPIMAIHRDPLYYPDPDRFDPERFSDENKAKIIPGAYIPFGVGPRNCIGSRFALLEMKTLFFHLLSKFDIVVIDKTEIPLKISPNKMSMSPEEGFNLGLRPRKSI